MAKALLAEIWFERNQRIFSDRERGWVGTLDTTNGLFYSGRMPKLDSFHPPKTQDYRIIHVWGPLGSSISPPCFVSLFSSSC